MRGKLITLILGILVTIRTSGGTSVEIRDLVRTLNHKLSDKQVNEITDSIYQYASAFDIDTKLLAAIAATESRFDPHAKGKVGEIGLYQLRPEFHLLQIKNKKTRTKLLYDVDTNVRTAAKYLSALQVLYGTKYPKLNYVELYNRGPATHPTKFPYARKIKNYYRLLGGEV